MFPFPPLEVLHPSEALSRMQPKSLEYWSQAPCSPVTTGTRKTLRETGQIFVFYVCAYFSALTDEGLSRTRPEESDRDRKEDAESADWPRYTSISTE